MEHNKQISNTERVLILLSYAPAVIAIIGVILFIVGFALYSSNDLSGVLFILIAPLLVIAYPFLKGFEYIVRAAVRYLQNNGQPYGN